RAVYPKRGRQGGDCGELPNSLGCCGVANNGHTRDAWRSLLEKPHPLPASTVIKNRKAGRVASGACQAFDKPRSDWIRGLREHDWHGARCLKQRCYERAAGRKDYVRRQRDEFGSKFPNLFAVTGDPASIDAHTTAIDPTQFLQALQKGRKACLSFLIVGR